MAQIRGYLKATISHRESNNSHRIGTLDVLNDRLKFKYDDAKSYIELHFKNITDVPEPVLSFRMKRHTINLPTMGHYCQWSVQFNDESDLIRLTDAYKKWEKEQHESLKSAERRGHDHASTFNETTYDFNDESMEAASFPLGPPKASSTLLTDVRGTNHNDTDHSISRMRRDVARLYPDNQTGRKNTSVLNSTDDLIAEGRAVVGKLNNLQSQKGRVKMPTVLDRLRETGDGEEYGDTDNANLTYTKDRRHPPCQILADLHPDYTTIRETGGSSIHMLRNLGEGPLAYKLEIAGPYIASVYAGHMEGGETVEFNLRRQAGPSRASFVNVKLIDGSDHEMSQKFITGSYQGPFLQWPISLE